MHAPHPQPRPALAVRPLPPLERRAPRPLVLAVAPVTDWLAFFLLGCRIRRLDRWATRRVLNHLTPAGEHWT